VVHEALLNSTQFLRDLRRGSTALNYPTNYFPRNSCGK